MTFVEGSDTRTADVSSGDDQARSTGRLLATLMGDYWYAGRDYIPSAALVDMLAEFGVGEAAARAALSRLTCAGRLEGIKTGRTTAYRVAPPVVEAAKSVSRALALVGAGRVRVGREVDLRRLLGAGERPPPAARPAPPAAGAGARPPVRRPVDHARRPADALDRALTDVGVAEAVVLRVVDVPRSEGGPAGRLGPRRHAGGLRHPARRPRADRRPGGRRGHGQRRRAGRADPAGGGGGSPWSAATPGCPTRCCPTTGPCARPAAATSLSTTPWAR